jgi:hypothetical protein
MFIMTNKITIIIAGMGDAVEGIPSLQGSLKL